MLKAIVSAQNALVKRAAALQQKKYRRESGEFLVEGIRSVEEAVRSDFGVSAIFFTEDALAEPRHAALLGEAAKVACYQVSTDILKKISDTETPQRVIAVVRQRETGLDTFVPQPGSFVLVLDRVADPGNVGTIIRTADAAGAAGIILLSGCADLYNPKVIRATMGSIFHLPVWQEVSGEELCAWCGRSGVKLIATGMRNGVSIYDAVLPSRTALVLGSEAEGVAVSLQDRAEQTVFIPMTGGAESLNVAVAAGILSFEISRRNIAN